MSFLASTDNPLRTAAAGLALAVAMFGFGYAMVPLYYRICAALGIDTATPEVLQTIHERPAPGRPVRMEFDANSHNDLVAMRPATRIAKLQSGKAYQIVYELENLTGQRIQGLAVPSYSPQRVARWVKKLHCFCFEELQLGPYETRSDPVVLILDQEMPDDIEVVAMSYTFHLNMEESAHADDGHAH